MPTISEDPAIKKPNFTALTKTNVLCDTPTFILFAKQSYLFHKDWGRVSVQVIHVSSFNRQINSQLSYSSPSMKKKKFCTGCSYVDQMCMYMYNLCGCRIKEGRTGGIYLFLCSKQSVLIFLLS